MNKEEKRNLFCKLLEARPHGEGAAKLAKWCRTSASAVYRWQEPGGPWPFEEKEARLWAYFGYTVDERGNPVPNAVPPLQIEAAAQGDDAELSSDDVIQGVFELVTGYLKHKTRQIGGEMRKDYGQITAPTERRAARPKKRLRTN